MPVVGLHLTHFRREQIAALDKHNRRLTCVRSNKDVDLDLKSRNITLISPPEGTLYRSVKKYENSAKEKGFRLRKDTRYCSSVIVSCPREYSEKADVFLAQALLFLQDKISCPCLEAVIHHDEAGLPHLHAVFADVTEDGRFCSKELFPRSLLSSLHSDLPAFMQERGFALERPTGEQTRNRGSLHYQDFKKEMEREKAILAQDYNNLVERYNQLAEDYESLFEKKREKQKKRSFELER